MKTVDRTLQLLETLGRADGAGIGVTRLAEHLRDAPSTIHRLLTVLTKHRMVVQDPASRRYRLGPGVLALSDAYLHQNTLVAVAQAHLARLSGRVRETVFVTQLISDEAICVATAHSPGPLRFLMSVGQRMPYHAAASARSILAFQDWEYVQRLLQTETFRPFTATTPSSLGDVLEELRRVRARGYAACDEEMQVGVAALSVPIWDSRGCVVASISVVAPQQRLSGSQRFAALQSLNEAADAISSELGYQPAQQAVDLAADGSARLAGGEVT